MTTKQLLASHPGRVTMTDIARATGDEREAMAIINMNDAIRGSQEILMYEQYRYDDELVWVFWWKAQRPGRVGRRLMATHTNLEEVR